MFWNTEFLDSAPSHIDVVLQTPTVKLSDILFEDDLLQELKASNINLDNFLTRPDIIAELVDNITQLTEKDCCDKLLYSNVHAAYISCEILTGGPSEIFASFMNHPESLNKIISCLTIKPKQQDKHQQKQQEQQHHQQHEEQQQLVGWLETPTCPATIDNTGETNEGKGNKGEQINEFETSQNLENKIDDKDFKKEDANENKINKGENNSNDDNNDQSDDNKDDHNDKLKQELNEDFELKEEVTPEENHEEPLTDDTLSLSTPSRPKSPMQTPVLNELNNKNADHCSSDDSHELQSTPRNEKEDYNEIRIKIAEAIEQVKNHIFPSSYEAWGPPDEDSNSDSTSDIVYMTKVVPQKATLVSKLINTIHTQAAAKLSCHITQDIGSFSRLIELLVQNIDISGAFEILSTFIKRTESPELRYVYCEILSNLKFVQKLIDVMTLSDIEDKQRNACQLLCDIIVIGRQDASEQTSGPKAQDMLSELLESDQAAHVMLEQMFLGNMRNTTAIVCGMKVLQTLLENKLTADQQTVHQQNNTIEKIQGEIEKHLIKFHELLLNPPKQQPIKTTFGIIQKPLGYMRLEVVNLIRALIGTNSPNIIRKLVELKTMKVIIDLFIEYSWNNLLHTQVEQALCLIINNCRKDEEEFTLSELFAQCNQFNKHQGEVWKQTQNENDMVVPESAVIDQQNQESEEQQKEHNSHEGVGEKVEDKTENDEPSQEPSKTEIQIETKIETQTQPEQPELSQENSQSPTPRTQQQHPQDQESPNPQDKQSPQIRQEKSVTKIPSVALLSQLLNECDLIGRLLMPSSLTNRINLDYQRRRNGEQANFGHIIQMINSIAINRDLDTIREHLNEMKDKRAELYDRWTTFVNVDVASFKEVSLYYDAQSATNHIDNRFSQTRHGGQISNNRFVITPNVHSLGSQPDNGKSPDNNADDQFLAYVAFAREVVLPSINIDVLPTPREMYKTIQNH